MIFVSKSNDSMCTVSMGTQLLKNMNQGFGRYLGTVILVREDSFMLAVPHLDMATSSFELAKMIRGIRCNRVQRAVDQETMFVHKIVLF